MRVSDVPRGTKDERGSPDPGCREDVELALAGATIHTTGRVGKRGSTQVASAYQDAQENRFGADG